MNRKSNPAKIKKSRERRMEQPVGSTDSTSMPAEFGRMNSGCSPTAPFAEKMAPDSRYAEGKLRYNAIGENFNIPFGDPGSSPRMGKPLRFGFARPPVSRR